MFSATFDSLRTYQAPEWFKDAKLGIWSHWGPQSVPMFGDWYARNMYIQGTTQYEYHLRHYGHPSKFGYKDICALWKAENFDPDALMDKYVKAGAKYFMTQATHHDHFFNYDSALNSMNSVKVGPNKDILALWKAAADKRGLRFGVSEHLAASFNWWRCNKGCDKTGPYAGVPYDGNDPKYKHFYHDNVKPGEEVDTSCSPWYTDNPQFRKYWLDVMKEIIGKFQPDLLYSDGSLPFGENWHEMKGNPPVRDEGYIEGLEAVKLLYNTSIEKNGANEAVYLQKDRREEVYAVGVLDIEKSQLPGITPRPWHTDTCIGNWFYDVHNPYKSPAQVIEMLVDIIAKNGCMLLNILQRPDGTIDEDADWILSEMAAWMNVCGDAVFGTRPWDVFGEGDTRVVISGFTENKTDWNQSDYRFVQKNGSVYAFMLGAKAGQAAVLRSFAERKVKNVSLLGVGNVPFEQKFGLLTVQLPEKLPVKYANALKIDL